MPWAAAAVVGGALLTSSAASDAADQQAAGTDKALAETAREYDTTRADYAPYRAAGTTALGQLATENNTPLDQSTVQLDPGYEFGLTQGQQAIDRKTAAAGGRISGAALKEAAQYGTDYATTGYSAAYSRADSARTDRLNRLAALAGIGQTATAGTTAAGTALTSSSNALTTAAGSTAGAATLAQGNIWGNAGNQIAALYGKSSGDSSSSRLLSDAASAGDYTYTPTALPINKSALEDTSWFVG